MREGEIGEVGDALKWAKVYNAFVHIFVHGHIHTYIHTHENAHLHHNSLTFTIPPSMRTRGVDACPPLGGIHK
ncbi:hypothetical protein POVWA1_007370 [Plasmodium ovale wallikeri]|uniref:Uncharacterized protein n=1 Tax=Plasmodium ovale wallikeri TaxID=864142 RepID=A0A1A8YJG4_PLAOA|nr:hypothetical protein POVWA1_007370 [Plasmodium ovale wallikeri]